MYQSQGEIHIVAARAVPRTSSLKSHPKDYHQKLIYTETVTHPRTKQGRCCLTQPNQAVYYSSMPITTDISTFDKHTIKVPDIVQ